MSRPELTSRGDRTVRRETIVAAAAAAFTTHGYSSVSMSRIAAQVGGSKGTLYNYFRSKEELFDAVVQRETGSFLGRMLEASTEPKAEERLRDMAVRLIDLVTSPQAIALQRLVIAEAVRFPELARLFYAAGPKLILDYIEGELLRLVQAGDLKAPSTRQAALHFRDLAISQFNQLSLCALQEPPSPAQRAEHAAAAVSVFLSAFGRPREGRRSTRG